MNKPIIESELRHAMRAHLSAHASLSNGRVIEELGIEGGDARVDLALIDSHLNAFELKSDLDSFGRMHNQIHAYGRVFDRVTIVTGPVFTKQACAVTPGWWGIWAAHRNADESIELRTVREAAINPAQEMRSMAMLLWRAECIEVLTAHTGRRPSNRATRANLHAQLTAAMDLCALRTAVANSLLHRNSETAQHERTHVRQISTTNDGFIDCLV